MYLKILVQKTETSPFRTVTVHNVERVDYFITSPKAEEWNKWCNRATEIWTPGRDPETTGITKIGCLDIEKTGGKTRFIIIDYMAFLCNEQGKAVERYVV